MHSLSERPNEETYGALKVKPLISQQVMEMEKDSVGNSLGTNSKVNVIKSGTEQISLELHKQILKWLSLLYLINIIFFFLFFVIVYIYK